MKIDKRGSSRFRRAKKLELQRKRIKILTIGAMIIVVSIWSHHFNQRNTIDSVVNPPLTSEYEQNINNNEQSQDIIINKGSEVIIDQNQTPLIEEEILQEEPIKETTVDNISDIDENDNKEVTTITEQNKEQDVIVEEPKKKMIALSYDDGPSKTLTRELLKILQDNDCTATFFVLGNKVKKYSDIIYELHNAGNEIGNHSYDHSDLSKLSKEQIINQFNKTEQAIYEVTNEYPTFFRPPYGALSDNVRTSISSPLVLWSIDSNDWRPITDEQVINNVISSLADGKIILMHDIHKRTIEVSKILIPKIKELGYEIVSIEKLYESNNIELEDGKVYSKVKKN